MLTPVLRRRAWLGAVVIVAGLAMGYASGPRYTIGPARTPVALPPGPPEVLERYLAERELAVGDVIPGAEKTIIWATPARQQTPLSVVYLHGYSATRQETAPLSDDLARALGANLFYTRLSGHGRAPAAMGEITGTDWLQDAEEALAIGRRIGQRVIVVGTSTGGTLGTWLALQPASEAMAALVLVSPNFGPKNALSEVLTGPWGPQLLRLLQGDEYTWTPLNAEQARYWTWRYPSKALLPMMAVVTQVRDAPLEQVQVPTLVIYSPNDQVVNPTRTERAFARFGTATKALQPVLTSEDPDHHVLAGRILAPNDTAMIGAYIRRFLTGVLGLPA
jgi:esterase/lipase